MKRRPLLVSAMLLAFSPALAGADRDFEAIVKGLETHLDSRRTRIPLFGVVKLFVKVARPEGVKQLDLAIFDHVQCPPPDNDEFEALVRGAAGDRWRPLVRARSQRHQTEWTHIYARLDGEDVQFLVATFEPSEAVLVKLRLSGKALFDLVDEPCTMGRRLKKQGDH